MRINRAGGDHGLHRVAIDLERTHSARGLALGIELGTGGADADAIYETGGGTVTIRVLAKCLPDKHWGVQRAIRRRCKEALDAAGIAGPPAFAPPTTSTSTGGPA